MSTRSRPRPRPLRTSGARLDLRDRVVRAGDHLLFTIVNGGKRQLLAGTGYGFERRSAFVWRPQHIDQAFAAVGLPLSTGERTREMFALVPEGFRPGRYRLTATVTLLNPDGGPARGRDDWPVNVRISQTFKVRRPSP